MSAWNKKTSVVVFGSVSTQVFVLSRFVVKQELKAGRDFVFNESPIVSYFREKINNSQYMLAVSKLLTLNF